MLKSKRTIEIKTSLKKTTMTTNLAELQSIVQNISNEITAEKCVVLDDVLPTSNINTDIQSIIAMQSTEKEDSDEEDEVS